MKAKRPPSAAARAVAEHVYGEAESRDVVSLARAFDWTIEEAVRYGREATKHGLVHMNLVGEFEVGER